MIMLRRTPLLLLSTLLLTAFASTVRLRDGNWALTHQLSPLLQDIQPGQRRLALAECQPIDCDYDDECAEGLICADSNEGLLLAAGLDLNLAYCDVTVTQVTEVCFDPNKVDIVNCGRRNLLQKTKRYYHNKRK